MPQSFSEAEPVEQIAQQLIASYHPELATARIKFIFQEKAGKKGGKVILGKTQKVSGILEFYAECDFRGRGSRAGSSGDHPPLCGRASRRRLTHVGH